MSTIPSGSTSVMARRAEPRDSLDLFCTPPWGTRALPEELLGTRNLGRVWDPCSGLGHMSDVLTEYAGDVHASDVHDYGRGAAIGSFVGEGPDVARGPWRPDWIIANPPFRLGTAFVERALEEVRVGVAMIFRSTWIESGERFRLLRRYPLSTYGVFAERVPMHKGRWLPGGKSATAYSWFVWRRLEPDGPYGGEEKIKLIPPHCRRRYTRPDDVERFAGRRA
jgi:hypothetical protein